VRSFVGMGPRKLFASGRENFVLTISGRCKTLAEDVSSNRHSIVDKPSEPGLSGCARPILKERQELPHSRRIYRVATDRVSSVGKTPLCRLLSIREGTSQTGPVCDEDDRCHRKEKGVLIYRLG
jgi:hypothetical protein